MEKDFTKPYNPEDTKQDFQEKNGSKKSKLEKAIRIGKNITLGLAFLGFMGWSFNRTCNRYTPFTEQDYKNAKWYSSSATPDEAYNFEKIPHNQMTREFYFQQVKEKNGSLKNAALYPDLDGDGKVAQ